MEDRIINGVRVQTGQGCKPTPKHQQKGWHGIDEEASREGRAKSAARVSLPSVYGRRIEGTKARYSATKVATGFNIGVNRARKTGKDD